MIALWRHGCGVGPPLQPAPRNWHSERLSLLLTGRAPRRGDEQEDRYRIEHKHDRQCEQPDGVSQIGVGAGDAARQRGRRGRGAADRRHMAPVERPRSSVGRFSKAGLAKPPP
jgi:hypothetical protein